MYNSNQNNSNLNNSNLNKVLQKLLLSIECICCIPITLYGLYLEYKNPSYKYDIILDQPTIKALVDNYI